MHEYSQKYSKYGQQHYSSNHFKNKQHDYPSNYSKYEKQKYASTQTNYEKRDYNNKYSKSNSSKYEKRVYNDKYYHSSQSRYEKRDYNDKYSQTNQSRQQILKQESTTTLKQTSSQETQEKPVRRQRPVTSDVVARRLISSALGIKPKEKTAEEKEIDRKKFEEARAQRQAARLERQRRLQENSDIFNE